MNLKKDVKLIHEIIGEGDLVIYGNYHLLSIRISLNKGDIIKSPNELVGFTLDYEILEKLAHSKEKTLVHEDEFYYFCVQIHRENFPSGCIYALEGMRIGGYRKVSFGSHLAFGENGIADIIPPNAKITLEINVIR
jgi:hypothetical protein